MAKTSVPSEAESRSSVVVATPAKTSSSQSDNPVPVKTPTATSSTPRIVSHLDLSEIENSPSGRKIGHKVEGERRKNAEHRKSSTTAPTLKPKKSLDDGTNRKVTEYFPVRRSTRKPEVDQKRDAHYAIEDALFRTTPEQGLKIVHTELKGRGIHSTRTFETGAFIVEYRGELLPRAEGIEREVGYNNAVKDPGSYVYYFGHAGKAYCIDATAESPYKGRLLNHSLRRANVKTRVHVDVHGTPHLILVAKRSIGVDVELLYDYGDKDKETIARHPWLTKS